MNTIGTSTIGTSWRHKYFSATLQHVLKHALVAEKICMVDNSDIKYIFNPYSNQPTATVQAIAGTYSVSAYTVTDDSLTVDNEVIYSEHIYDFERVMNNYDLMADRVEEMSYAIAFGIDQYVLNSLGFNATGTYSTPVGGFTTAANINQMIGDLCGKVMGYADTYKGLFLVIENTEVTGFLQAMVSNGFTFADAALNNGWMGNYMGVEIYVVRSGTFTNSTIGTLTTPAMSGHRIFGVKEVATYASPRNIQYEEKGITAATGKEIAVYGYVGFKLWTQKAGLIVNITLN